MTFKEQEELEKRFMSLTKEQQNLFVWRCAIKVLPILGIEGHFGFWKKDELLKHIFSLFSALDLLSIKIIHNRSPNIESHRLNRIFNTINAFSKTKEAGKHIYSSVSASYICKSITYSSLDNAFLSIVNAIEAIDAYTLFYINSEEDQQINDQTFEFLLVKLKRNILNELKKNNSITKINDYGIIWTNFIKALNKINCTYWANWYQQLFENDFEFDIEEVIQRVNLPEETKAQGAAAVGVEMERILREGSERLNEARIIILGDKGVGKTCIARKLCDPKAPMTKKNESTPGVDTTLWKLKTDADSINVRIWDFAGHTVTHAAHQFFLSERSLYILVYDGRSEERNRLRYWLDHVKNYGGTNSKAIILINEQDKHTVDIPINTLKSEYPIEGLYSFNIKSDKKDLEQFRKIVSNYIIHNPSWEKQQVSKSYYQVKNELERLFAKNIAKDNEFIKKEQFLEIAQKHAIEDKDADTLLKSLHALGISLWYPKLSAYNTLILNPEWISNGVYKIINWVNNQDTHTILLSEFLKIFKEETQRFPKEKHKFLFDLMINYELAYTLNGKRLVIPHLLNEDQPENLPVFPGLESLSLRYEANQILPPNTICRFIALHHTNIKTVNKKSQVWRYGVILEDDNRSIALVKEKGKVISVYVRGKSKTQFISIIRTTLNQIFDTYKSLEPTLTYKLVDESLKSDQQLYLTEQKIINHVLRNRTYYDDISNQDIPLNRIIKIYNITYNNHNYSGDIQNLISGNSKGNIINTNFNFQNCNLELQGELNQLIEKLSKTKHQDELEDLEKVVKVLDEVEDLTDKKEVKKKLKKNNIPKRIGRFFEEFGDDKSKINKTIKGMKNGVKMVKNIAKGYNKIAKWLDLDTLSDIGQHLF